MKKKLIILAAILCCSCTNNSQYSSVTPINKRQHATSSNSFVAKANQLLHESKDLSLIDARKKQLKAIATLLDGELITEAEKLFPIIDVNNMGVEISSEKAILEAKLHLLKQDPETALKILRSIWLPKQISQDLQITLYETRAKAYLRLGNGLEAVRAYVALSQIVNKYEKQEHYEVIWKTLNQLPINALNLATTLDNSEFNGWVQLNKITRKNDSHPQELIADLKEWHLSYGEHPGRNILPGFQSIDLDSPMFPKKIAVLLPLSGKYESSAKVIQQGILSAFFEEKSKGANDSPEIKFIDTKEGKKAKQAYKKALEFGADFIIGPLTKEGVTDITKIKQLLSPVLALNQVPSKSKDNKLFQFGLLPEDEALSVAEKAWEDGHRRALVIVPDSEWGERLSTTFVNSWQEKNGTILNVHKFTQKYLTKTIKESLHLVQSERRLTNLKINLGRHIDAIPRRRKDIDFIFLVSTPKEARQIKPLLNFYYASNVPVYATSSIYSGAPSKQDQDLDSIKFCDIPWLLDDDGSIYFKRKHSEQILTIDNPTFKRLFAFGIDAYKLTSQINYLAAFPMLGTNGMTGRLKLQNDKSILRQLTWAKMKNGNPTPIVK